MESKGKLTKDDRDKLVWATEQNPDMRFVILFQRANNPIRKGSKTRYRDWCDSVGIEWYDWETQQEAFMKRIIREN